MIYNLRNYTLLQIDMFTQVNTKKKWLFLYMRLYAPYINFEEFIMNQMKVPSVSTHKGHILYRLLRGARLRNKQLFHEIDTCASGARFCELRSDGWDIQDKFLYTTTKENKQVHVKEYFIKSDTIKAYKQLESVQDFLNRYDSRYPSDDIA